MAGKNDAWGIEVGMNAIKAVHLSADGDHVVVEDFEVHQFKRILTTPDIDAEEAIQLGLDALLTKHDISKSNVVISVPGDMAFARFAKLPPVEPKKIPEIVKFEAVQQIPFPIEEVEWDYQVFASEDSPDVEVGIFAILSNRCASFLEDYHAVGITPDGMTLSPLAVYNAMVYDKQLTEDDTGTVFVDIGTTSTDVIIVDGNGVWLRTVNMGGNDFTDALVSAFKLSFPKAEKLKREARTSKYARQIYQAMRPVFSDFVQELQRSLGYYQSLNRDVDIEAIIGVGSTFKLPGLQKYLKQQLNMEVKRLSSFERLAFDDERKKEDFTDYAVNMATAYGLALQGLGEERISANILPKSEIKKKIWKSKQPWFAAAAMVMFLAVLASGFKVYNDNSEWKEAEKQYKTVIQSIEEKANMQIRELDQFASRGVDPRIKIENIEKLLDYRDIMPQLAYDIDRIAKTMQWQPELLEANYENILNIPRGDRNRIYIERFMMKYEYNGDADTPVSELWKPTEAVEEGIDSDPDSVHPPRFRIRLEGRTSNANAPQFLAETIIKWLQSPEQLGGESRPYVVRSVSNPIRSMNKIDAPPPKRLGPPMGPRGDLMMVPNQVMGPMGINRTRSQFAHLLPQRPLANEGDVGDWQFKIEWVVEIVAPDKLNTTPVQETPQASSDDVDAADQTLSILSEEHIVNREDQS